MADKESQVKGFDRIQISYNDSQDKGLPKIKAFHGKWIYDLQNPYTFGYGPSYYSVAETTKGNFVFMVDVEGRRYNYEFLVYPSLQAAAADSKISRSSNQRNGKTRCSNRRAGYLTLHSIYAGLTFLFPMNDTHQIEHLWVVATNPDKDELVAVVNITTLQGAKDQTVVLRSGEHQFVKHDSCVNYTMAEIVKVEKLQERFGSGRANATAT